MGKVLTALFSCLTILGGIVETASGAAVGFGQKTASGSPESNPNIYTYELGSLGQEPCWFDEVIHYDPATGVLYYVRQNPWSKFDPHGLQAFNLKAIREQQEWMDDVPSDDEYESPMTEEGKSNVGKEGNITDSTAKEIRDKTPEVILTTAEIVTTPVAPAAAPTRKGILSFLRGVFSRKPVTSTLKTGHKMKGAIGSVDDAFVKLGMDRRVEAAYAEIEATFGSDYANAIRQSVGKRHRYTDSTETLGEFTFTTNGQPMLELSRSVGNAKMLAMTIMHESRHFRHAKKLNLTAKQYVDQVSERVAEVYATAPNISQAKRLGLSGEDMQIFQNY